MRMRRRRKPTTPPRPATKAIPAYQRNVDDGALTIVDLDGRLRHRAPGDVTRALRYALARLQTSEKGDVRPRICVTSALLGEGVTFVASSLAALLANDLRRKVCLVDLNWWSTGDNALYGPRSSVNGSQQQFPGVAQVIEGERALDEVLIPTEGWKLSLLPAGPASPADRPVLVKAPALVKLIDQLELRFDHVVLDVPPVLGNGEALTLASLAEHFILVVRQGVTAEVQVQSALEELRHLSPLGIVLNRASSNVPQRLVHLLAQ
jgi:Mrp family chromosome partitioning ATPase